MAKQTEVTQSQTATTSQKSTRALKKVSAANIKLADQEVGFEFEGKYVGIATSPFVDKEGEEKTLHTLVIENETGRVKMLADAGLRMALQDALVTKGDWFKAVKGPKENIGRGRTMNSWDIFQYAENN